MINDTLLIKVTRKLYNVYERYYKKEKNIIYTDTIQGIKFYKSYQAFPYELERWDKIEAIGSISRAISIGTNQNATLSSTMNLTIEGKIGDNYQVKAVLTDNQLPFQPLGNTYQIQDFNKVFITVFNNKNNLTLGDIELNKDENYLSIKRKIQGISYSFSNDKIKLETSNSISKGKYKKQIIKPIDGIQGPYKLYGENNEPFIVILSGTEKVYVDNQLLKRGENNDYVINYNSAEITFTPKVIITSESRIIVEFQYTDLNYLRYLSYSNFTFESEKITNKTTLYYESDLKNRPLLYQLTDSNKLSLMQAGDNKYLATANFWTKDSIKNENTIYYKLIDTTYNGKTYKIFIYSSDSSATYRVNFSNVGKNKGNYILENINVNGRVYKWVAPINDIPQGEYEPIWYLPMPERKILLGQNLLYKINNKNSIMLDVGISYFDKNIFSNIQDDDNFGTLVKVIINNDIKKDSISSFGFSNKIEFLSKNFVPIERYRYVDFNRDWNYTKKETNNEILLESKMFLKYKNFSLAPSYSQLTNFTYNGIKPSIELNLILKKLKFNNKSSYLFFKDSTVKGTFLINSLNTNILLKRTTFGNNLLYEENITTIADTFSQSSFKNLKYETYLENLDTSNFFTKISYIKWINYKPQYNKLKKQFISDEIKTFFKKNHKNFNLNTIFSFRNYNPIKENLTKTKNINSIINLSYKIKENFLYGNFSHSVLGILESRQIFQFIEVAPGKGNFAWYDFNNNGIKEIDEFVLPKFPTDAKYIKIVSPNIDYFNSYNPKISKSLTLYPSTLLKKESKFYETISKFKNNFSFTSDLKTTSNNFIQKIIPFDLYKDSILSQLYIFNNHLSISDIFSFINFSYIFQKQKNILFLLYGNRTTKNKLNSFNFSLPIYKDIILYIEFLISSKASNSPIFTNDNFFIKNKEIKSFLNYQPDFNFRLTPYVKFSSKKEILTNIKAEILEFSFEINRNFANKANLNLKYSIFINKIPKNNFFNNSFIMYEMLEGLDSGINHMLNILFNINISEKTLFSLNYQMKKTLNKYIHYGNAEFRMFF